MSFLSRMLGKKTREARQTMAAIENRDLMQACVYGCFYIASADGDIEASEIDKIDRLLRNARQLQGFGQELVQTIERARADFLEGGARIIRMNAERELTDLAHDPKNAEVVLNFMITVAEADGEIEVPAEMDVLKRAAGKMGLRLEDFL